MSIVPVILSGGTGTRLWPMSRKLLPKQFLPLVGEHTMLQDTVERLAGLADCSAPVVVANTEHRFLAAEQLREIGAAPRATLLEPVGRNTAPAIAAAALAVAREEPDAALLVLPSDHLIRDVPAFHAAVGRARDAAQAGFLVTFGIRPSAPATGYGYIEAGEALEGVAQARRIKRFVEHETPWLHMDLSASRCEGGLGIVALMAVSKKSEFPVVAAPDRLSTALALHGVFVDGATRRRIDWQVHRSATGLVVFLGIGVLAGMFGIGAGWANVPALNLLMGAPLKVSAGTSGLVLSLVDSSAAWVYVNKGAVLPMIAVPSVIGMMLGAKIGARLLDVLKGSVIRRMVIGVLLFAGARALLKGTGVWP